MHDFLFFLLETSQNRELISRRTGRSLVNIRDEAVRAAISDVTMPPLQRVRELATDNWDPRRFKTLLACIAWIARARGSQVWLDIGLLQ